MIVFLLIDDRLLFLNCVPSIDFESVFLMMILMTVVSFDQKYNKLIR